LYYSLAKYLLDLFSHKPVYSRAWTNIDAISCYVSPYVHASFNPHIPIDITVQIEIGIRLCNNMPMKIASIDSKSGSCSNPINFTHSCNKRSQNIIEWHQTISLFILESQNTYFSNMKIKLAINHFYII
jgi:hypothetical protein